MRAGEAPALLAVERQGLRVVDVACAMNKSPDTLAKAIRRATQRRVRHANYTRTLDKVDITIAEGSIDHHNDGMA